MGLCSWVLIFQTSSGGGTTGGGKYGRKWGDESGADEPKQREGIRGERPPCAKFRPMVTQQLPSYLPVSWLASMDQAGSYQEAGSTCKLAI